MATMESSLVRESAEKTATASEGAPQNAGLWTRFTDKVPFLKTKRGLAVAIVAIAVIIGGGLAGLAALRTRRGDGSSADTGPGGAGSSSNAILSDAHFYGESPPVYPARELIFGSRGMVLMAGSAGVVHHCCADTPNSKHRWYRNMESVARARAGYGGKYDF